MLQFENSIISILTAHVDYLQISESLSNFPQDIILHTHSSFFHRLVIFGALEIRTILMSLIINQLIISGYPIYVSPLTTSYVDTHEGITSVVGGPFTVSTLKQTVVSLWRR